MKPAVVLAVVLSLAACSAASPSASEPAGGTVTVTSANGEVTVPVTDSRIWALDYQTALNLLALGVVPAHAGKYGYATDPFVSAAYTILTKAGVELVEPGKAELVAAAAPELIVGMPNTGSDPIVPQLREIAPVVILPGLPVLQDTLDTLGAITGHQAEAAAVAQRLQTARTDLARRVKGSKFAGAAVSALSACGEDAFCVYGNARGFGPILTDLGLRRPPRQALKGNEWGYENLSPENLGEHKAEIIIAFVGSVSFGAPSPFKNPLLDTSGSRTGEVDFSAWFGVGPLNQVWVLNDIDALLFGKGRIADASAGPALWARVTSAS
ncbi:ABC transporter substrate-binding protein [Nonomuraea endophytica]|uniref:ABC transporter substrate-binding protein n=1 Tax=Nonomuraea endophytica TaxID=714136 RepID=UPI0037C519D0